jgi:hypothetical protein
MTEAALKTIAMNYIKHGRTLEELLSESSGYGSPGGNGKPQKDIVLNFGYLWPSRDAERGINIRRGQIGVALYWDDGRNEHGIFSVRELWEEMNRPVVQMRLFE